MNLQEATRKAMACLRLAERGGTPEESAAAASKAQEIIDRYKLDVNSLDFDAQEKERDDEAIKDYGYDDPLDYAKVNRYESHWSIRLASIVSRANQCRIVYRSSVDATGRKVGATIRVIGRPSDVATVRYLYSYFKQEVVRLAKMHTVGHSRAYHGQFCIGVCDAISEKVAKSQEQTFVQKREELATNPLALVRLNSSIAKIEKRGAEVDAYIAATIKPKGGSRGINNRVFTGGREHGRREGQSIRMTRASASLGSGQRSIGGGK